MWFESTPPLKYYDMEFERNLEPNKALNIGRKDIPFLFKYQSWHLDPYEYILVYEENEEKARIKGAEGLYYNCGDPMEPSDLECVTKF